MTEMESRLSGLTPEQRALLEARLVRRRAPAAVPPPEQEAPPTRRPSARKRPLSFSVFFFSDDGAASDTNAYRLVLEAARFADKHGFEAVWFPERHFNDFGGLYANPSVLGAAVAVVTDRLRIRAGSVVVPLHHPARVAEEWAMVDNLSSGRVGLAAASGWVREDFSLSDANFDDRREETFRRLAAIRSLWKGDKIEVGVAADGRPVTVRTFPRPVQQQLDIWITTAGTPETWQRAGREGYNVLTGLTQSSLDAVERNIGSYRAARQAAGHDPASGRVTLMMHTFLAASDDEVRRTVRDPLIRYMEGHLNIYDTMPSVRENLSVDPSTFTADDRTALAEHAFSRYYAGHGLFGTPETCLVMTDRLQAMGVDEVACLLDFGLPDTVVLDGLVPLNALRQAVQEAAEADAAPDAE